MTLPQGWRTEELGTLCQFINRGISPAYLEVGGIAVLNQKCIRDHDINFDLGRRHDAAAKRVTSERLLRSGDVLVNSTGTGTLGRVAQLREEPPEPTTVDSHVTIVRAVDGLFVPEFFGFALIALEEQIQQGGEGCGGQTELARSKLANDYRITFPVEHAEQRRIVSILDEAFEAIATAKANTERNLENAREVFERILEHLYFCSTADAQECSLEEVCEIRSTLVDPRLPSHIDAPHVGAGNIEARSGRLQNVLTAREEGLISGKFAFTRGAVLYSKIRPYLRKVARPEFDGLCSADIYPLDPIEQHTTRDFLFYLLLTSDFTAYAERGSARAGMPKVNRDHLFAYRFPLPPLATQRTIAGKLEEIREQSQTLTIMFASKLTALSELKQSLLHQAFTGALTAKSADRQLEQVA